MKVLVLLPFLVTLSEGVRSQTSLPDMPGPPYPDKYGYNRWGVKYDPEVEDADISSREDYSSSISPPWASALRPFIGGRSLLGKNRFNRRRNDNGYYTLRKSVRKSRRNPENEESTSELPMSISEIYASAVTTDPTNEVRYSTLNPQHNFFQPKATGKRGQFAKTLSALYNDYKPSEMVTSAISALRGSSSDDEEDNGDRKSKAKFTTIKVQSSAATGSEDDDYPPAFSRRPAPPPKSPIYRERPLYSSEDASIGSSASYKRPRGSLPTSYPPRPLSALYELYEDAPYKSTGTGSPSLYSGVGSDGANYISGGPFDELSFELSDAPVVVSGTRGSSGFSSGRPYESEGPSYPGSSPFSRPSPYSGSSPYSTPSSSSGPLRVTSYTMEGPPPSGFEGFSTSPFSSPSPSMSISSRPPPPYLSSQPTLNVAPGISISTPLASVGYLPPPGVYIPPNLSSFYPGPTSTKEPIKIEKPLKKLKRKRKRPAHTILRNMILGRKERRPLPPPPEFHEAESETKGQTVPPPPQQQTSPFVVMPPPVTVVANSPPQAYSPLVNSIPSAINPLALGAAGRFPQTAYPQFPGYIQPRPPAGVSQLAQSISTLRDAITGFRVQPPRYYYPPPPPPPPRQRPPPQASSSRDEQSDTKKEGTGPPPRSGPITQHLQDWPRIFTAVGSSVDAIAGGIHAVRKEITKTAGTTFAKGIMLGGGAAMELSKGMANVVQKMASI